MKKGKYNITYKLFIVFAMGMFVSFNSSAQETKRDSVRVEQLDSAYLQQLESMIMVAELQQSVEDYNKKALDAEMKFEYENLIPLVSGVVSVYARHDFIYNHPSVFEKTHYDAKDYAVAGAPFLAAWAMKLAGVKSRSTTRRMLAANGIALALAGGLTEGTKLIVNEPRPDLGKHSFPSGHTALAYVGATVLSREYGHVSPWISVGGYAAATATGLLRINHNAHWLNDIYMGAGIGVVSTNFGYWLADRIFGEEGINKPEMTRRDLVRAMKMQNTPSSIALVAASDLGKNTIAAENLTITDDASSLNLGDYHLHMSSLTLVGVEATWYLSPFLALEAIAQNSVGQAKVYYTGGLGDKTFTGNTLQLYRGSLALKGSLPLPGTSNRFGLRVLGGVRSLSKTDFSLTPIDKYKPDKAYTITLPKSTNFELGCGLSIDMLETTSHVVGINIDYYHAFSKVMSNRFLLSSVYRILF